MELVEHLFSNSKPSHMDIDLEFVQNYPRLPSVIHPEPRIVIFFYSPPPTPTLSLAPTRLLPWPPLPPTLGRTTPAAAARQPHRLLPPLPAHCRLLGYPAVACSVGVVAAYRPKPSSACNLAVLLPYPGAGAAPPPIYR